MAQTLARARSPADAGDAILKKNRWIKTSMGSYKSGSRIKEIQGFRLYVRKTALDDFLKKSSLEGFQNPYKQRLNRTGSNAPMGSPKENLTPILLTGCSGTNLPEIGRLSEYPSLAAARPDRPCILIGFDSEWVNLENRRQILSWQFALIHGRDLLEIVFLRAGIRELSLSLALGVILDLLKVKTVDERSIRRYLYCTGWTGNGRPVTRVCDSYQEARREGIYVYRDHQFTHERIDQMPDRFLKRSERDWAWFHTYLDYQLVDPVRVCLVCHTGKVDITSFDQDINLAVMRRLTEVQGGVITLQPIRMTPRSNRNVNNKSIYPVSLSVVDTLCHAPAGMKSLKALGNVVGVPKLELPLKTKEDMKALLEEDPALFMEYASTDSVVTMLYTSALYGYNNTPPVTVTSATAAVMKERMMEEMDCKDTEEFNRKYRGLQRVGHGLLPREDRPGYVESSSLEPVSDKANTVQYYASQAYHGGYNSCSEVGYFPQTTFDYDLQNAYPTAMCLVPDIDWESPIRYELQNQELDIRHWQGIGGINPLLPFVGYVRFQFPDSVKYPCIPVNVDGVPVYLRTSKGMNGVYAAGPYLYLALRLGATVFCERGFFLNTRYDESLRESRSLAAAVKQLVVDRNKAKEERGKGSLEELILKTMVNSGYGKNAQNVIQKQAWTAFRNQMEDLGCSAITNPVSAMMITAIVQVELLAAQNQCHEKGFLTCSVTTDGFISDCPEEILKTLDLYGVRLFMEQARLFLTDGKDPEIWEIKHAQNDLVNFTTRGNVSLYHKGNPYLHNGRVFAGVCAHNSTRSGYPRDSYDDRVWLMKAVLAREGTVDYVKDEWTSFKDMVKGKDFAVTPVTRHIRMDFDMKRKPDRISFHTDRVSVEDEIYTLAHFDTVPYETVDEFRLYRQKKALTTVLRTEKDWEIFWQKIDFNAKGSKIRDKDWAILFSCIMGHRSGMWTIPSLEDKSVEEKCEWINRHNESGKKFKPSDWKNARRPERQANMLPKEMIKDKLEELLTDFGQ